MTGADRIAGVVCLSFAAVLTAAGEFVAAVVKQMQSSAMEVARPSVTIVYTVTKPDLSSTSTWSVILLVLGLLLIIKSVVCEVRQVRTQHSNPQ